MTQRLDPDADLDFAFDWRALTHGVPNATSDWLAADEAILSHAITITPASGATLGAHSEEDGKVTFWLSGGVAGTRLSVTCHIETDQGRKDDRTRVIDVKER